MTLHTAEQVEQRYVAAMGPELGRTFNQLFNECAWLHFNWRDYVTLFGTSASRVQLMNKAVPAFFRRVQDALWDDALLHICRLTDKQIVAGKQTLSIQRLPPLVDQAFRPKVVGLVKAATAKCKFARDWRNRHIGHRDLGLALDARAVPLATASRKDVVEALKAIAAVLNGVECLYCNDAPVPYDFASQSDAVALLYLLRDGLDAREEWLGRLKARERRPADLVSKPPL